MNREYLMIILLASLMFGACSKDDESGNPTTNVPTTASKTTGYTSDQLTEAPVWQVDWNNNQDRPSWKDPVESQYGNWTLLKVKIEDTLRPYMSAGDLMALFVNGQLRGLSKPATVSGTQTLTGKFLLKAWGNESGTETMNISLRYYNQKLKHIFTLSADISFSSDESTGFDEEYVPAFTYGSAKYPVVRTVTAENILANAGITPVSGNMVGAFVGDECRGKASLSANGNTQLVVYGRSTGESVTLKYFDAAKMTLYTIADAVKIQ